GELDEPAPVQAHGARPRVQPLAGAGVAGRFDRERVEVAVAVGEPRPEDREGAVVALEDRAAVTRGQPDDGAVERHAGRREHAEQPTLLGPELRALERHEGAGLERALPVEHGAGIELLAHASAVADGTGALAAVEREEPGIERRKAGRARRAEESLRIQPLGAVGERDNRAA